MTSAGVCLAGGQDRVAGGAGGSVMRARNRPTGRLHIFQDGTHAIYAHKRDEFRALVIEFCRAQGIIAA